MRINIFLFIFIFILNNNAHASDNCYNHSNGIDSKNKICSYEKYKEKDKNLSLFIESEKSWVNYKDKNCNFIKYISVDRTLTDIIFNDCLERITDSRIQELNIILTDDDLFN